MAIATPLGTPEHNGVQPIYMTGKPAYVDVSGTHLVEVVYDNKNAMSLGGHLTIDAGNFYRLQSLVRTCTYCSPLSLPLWLTMLMFWLDRYVQLCYWDAGANKNSSTFPWRESRSSIWQC